jgi:hypothetical protein
MCNKLLHHHMCKLCNISKPFPPPWHMLFTHIYLWTNHLCISHKTQLVHLNYHSITKTKQGPFNAPATRSSRTATSATPSDQITCRRSASLCRARPPTERQSRHRLPSPAEHPPSTLLTFSRHRQAHAPPWASPPALGAPDLAYRALDPAPPTDAAISILTIATDTVLADPSPKL